ncbi:hypothetical protein A4157S3_510110 [Escherichia coli]|nr:hypothetical protein A4157S2_60134 [Escherichia coli]SOQ65145.1 hypothetical protein A4157S1_100056 [Escherichia coli]SOQ73711.1 hypothetical protein A4157S3_510110 [Escherichia coli]SOQ77032.1 hypothetical protein AT4157R_260112 [Escherichia coli]SOQ82578.1 hypothetical protein DSM301R_390111 [Escherichia coli]
MFKDNNACISNLQVIRFIIKETFSYNNYHKFYYIKYSYCEYKISYREIKRRCTLCTFPT